MRQTTGWGVCVSPQLIRQHGAWLGEQALDLLRPDCWLSWGLSPVVDRRNFMPLLYRREWEASRLAEQLETQPTVLLWNEPERSDQSNISPHDAREQTKEFLRQAWATNKQFRWAAPGVCIGQDEWENGLKWLTEYMCPPNGLRLQGIQRPSYWHVHSYRSGNLDTFRKSWRRWQEWYELWGANAPVILSEVCAEAGDLDAQKAVMRETRDMLERGDIVASLWFAAHRYDGVDWPQHALADYDLAAQRVTLNDLGRYWLELK